MKSKKDKTIVEDTKEITTNSKLEAEIAMYKDKYLRTLADYKNLENRLNTERQSMKIFFEKEFMNVLIPFLDNLDQASVFNQDQGLKMVRNSFYKTLEALGLTEVPLLGTKYTPETAEVLEVVDGENEDTIVEVLQKAYAIRGVVIRHGKVRVSKKNINS